MPILLEKNVRFGILGIVNNLVAITVYLQTAVRFAAHGNKKTQAQRLAFKEFAEQILS